MRLAKPQATRSRGFSLLELLVVIAIIGVLAALILGATMRTIAVQAQKNSQLLVQKLYGAMNTQWNATIEQAYNEAMPPNFTGSPIVVGTAGGDMRAIRALWIQLRLAQQFPQSYVAALNPGIDTNPPMVGLIPADPFYVDKLSTANAGDPPQVQSGILLWLILSNSRGGSASFSADSFTPREAIAPSLVVPVPGMSPGFSCVVDDWKQPLQFQRVQYMQVPTFANAAQLGNAVVPFDLPIAFYYVPILWSAGPTPNLFQPTITSYLQGG